VVQRVRRGGVSTLRVKTDLQPSMVRRSSFALMAALALAAVAYARPTQLTPTVKFGAGVLPSVIELCFRGVPKEPLAYSGDKVVEWEYMLPVDLAITNVVKRSKARRTFSFNLHQAGRTIRTTNYRIEIVHGVRPCVDVQVLNPFLSGNDVQRTGRLNLRVASEANFLGQASYSYTIEVQGRRRIWKGTDAFVNYCLNELKRLWSLNGKLYCWTEPVDRVTVRRLG
jgi:hypothetical protein